MPNNAKFNHLYTVDLVDIIEEQAFRKILEYLEPVLKMNLSQDQLAHFISWGTQQYRLSAMNRINDYYRTIYTHILQAVGMEWKHATKGTFPKRFSAYMYKQYGLKLDTDTLGKVGTLASASNSAAKTIYFDMFDAGTEPFWSSGSYGDAGSCLWGGKDGALSVFKTHKVMALRTYYDTVATQQKGWETLRIYDKHMYGRGRAWVYYIPEVDAYLFWNGYDSKGELQAIHYARIWATVSGMTYHKIHPVLNNGSDSGQIYINSGSGWLVHAMDNVKAELLKSYDFHFKIKYEEPEPEDEIWTCDDCGYDAHNGDEFREIANGRWICDECIQQNYIRCSWDSLWYHRQDSKYVDDISIIHEGTRYYGQRWYGSEFADKGLIEYAEDADVYMWVKHLYWSETDECFYSEKPSAKAKAKAIALGTTTSATGVINIPMLRSTYQDLINSTNTTGMVTQWHNITDT